jgi:hypothetical protein
MSLEKKSETNTGNGSGVRDDLADRLIEKREKFQYFIITGATAVIVFTFNNFNEPNGVLRLGPHPLTIVGWILLLLAAAAALGLFPLRHARYAGFLDLLEAGQRKPTGELLLKEQRSRSLVRFVEGVMGLAFVAGIGAITIAAAIGVSRVP